MPQPVARSNPPSLPNAAELGYSQITTIEPGRLAFISGQVARRRDGGSVPDGLVEQARIVTTNAKAALEAVGATPRDVVMARVYVVDLDPELMEEEILPHLLATFDGAQPSLTVIGVAALGAPGLRLEMEMVVRLPD